MIVAGENIVIMIAVTDESNVVDRSPQPLKGSIQMRELVYTPWIQ